MQQSKWYSNKITHYEMAKINSGNTQNWTISNNKAKENKFIISNPSVNPFITSDNFVKVQWVVPKNTVSYIIVNDYRLEKYIAWSSNWYFYANMDNDTMRVGKNLYVIKFYWFDNNVIKYYWVDNKLLHSESLTIIKK